MRVRAGDIVKRRGVPGDRRGRVIGFADYGGTRLVLVEWMDKRIFPNPSSEPGTKALEFHAAAADQGRRRKR